MAINANRKGKRIERELASRLRDLGFPEARRGQQYEGTPDSPDVKGVPGAWLDAKARKRIAGLWEWMEKASSEAGDLMPHLAIKGDGWSDFLIVLRPADWAKIYHASLRYGRP